MPGELPGDVVSSAWVDVDRPVDRHRRPHRPDARQPPTSPGRCSASTRRRAADEEDVADAFGEIANVVGGNVKAAAARPVRSLSLPDVGDAPAVRNPADICRVDVLWRGEPLSISVQGASRRSRSP